MAFGQRSFEFECLMRLGGVGVVSVQIHFKLSSLRSRSLATREVCNAHTRRLMKEYKDSLVICSRRRPTLTDKVNDSNKSQSRPVGVEEYRRRYS